MIHKSVFCYLSFFAFFLYHVISKGYNNSERLITRMELINSVSRTQNDERTIAGILRRPVLIKRFKSQRMLLLFLMPGFLAVVVFNYLPMVGILMAFEDYKPLKGFLRIEFVGFRYFAMFLKDPYFYEALKNTIGISFFSLVFGFPAPIVLALLIDSIRNLKFKKITQTITYLPHFISWVVIACLVYRILDVDSGILNIVLSAFGKEPVRFISTPEYFWTILIVTSILKEVGWGSIIYLAAIAGIDPELYSAAVVDGASRFKRLVYLTLPGIAPTVVLMLILSIGSLVTSNFDAVFNLSNPLVLSSAEVIETYVLRTGVMLGRYSFSTAIGFTQSVISFILVFIGIRLSKKYNDYAVI